MFIGNQVICSDKVNLSSNGIYVMKLGRKSIVQVVRTHLNLVLSLKPYE